MAHNFKGKEQASAPNLECPQGLPTLQKSCLGTRSECPLCASHVFLWHKHTAMSLWGIQTSCLNVHAYQPTHWHTSLSGSLLCWACEACERISWPWKWSGGVWWTSATYQLEASSVPCSISNDLSLCALSSREWFDYVHVVIHCVCGF